MIGLFSAKRFLFSNYNICDVMSGCRCGVVDLSFVISLDLSAEETVSSEMKSFPEISGCFYKIPHMPVPSFGDDSSESGIENRWISKYYNVQAHNRSFSCLFLIIDKCYASEFSTNIFTHVFVSFLIRFL